MSAISGCGFSFDSLIKFPGSSSGEGASEAKSVGSDNLFEDTAGQVASADMKDFDFEESSGQVASSGGLSLVA